MFRGALLLLALRSLCFAAAATTTNQGVTRCSEAQLLLDITYQNVVATKLGENHCRFTVTTAHSGILTVDENPEKGLTTWSAGGNGSYTITIDGKNISVTVGNDVYQLRSPGSQEFVTNGEVITKNPDGFTIQTPGSQHKIVITGIKIKIESGEYAVTILSESSEYEITYPNDLPKLQVYGDKNCRIVCLNLSTKTKLDAIEKFRQYFPTFVTVNKKEKYFRFSKFGNRSVNLDFHLDKLSKNASISIDYNDVRKSSVRIFVLCRKLFLYCNQTRNEREIKFSTTEIGKHSSSCDYTIHNSKSYGRNISKIYLTGDHSDNHAIEFEFSRLLGGQLSYWDSTSNSEISSDHFYNIRYGILGDWISRLTLKSEYPNQKYMVILSYQSKNNMSIVPSTNVTLPVEPTQAGIESGTEGEKNASLQENNNSEGVAKQGLIGKATSNGAKKAGNGTSNDLPSKSGEEDQINEHLRKVNNSDNSGNQDDTAMKHLPLILGLFGSTVGVLAVGSILKWQISKRLV